jgi:hypothetical protein
MLGQSPIQAPDRGAALCFYLAIYVHHLWRPDAHVGRRVLTVLVPYATACLACPFGLSSGC